MTNQHRRRIDKIEVDEITGEYIVIDYKSGKTKPDLWFLSHDLQLTAYAWACLEKYGQLPKKVVWHHLRTGEFLKLLGPWMISTT